MKMLVILLSDFKTLNWCCQPDHYSLSCELDTTDPEVFNSLVYHKADLIRISELAEYSKRRRRLITYLYRWSARAYQTEKIVLVRPL